MEEKASFIKMTRRKKLVNKFCDFLAFLPQCFAEEKISIAVGFKVHLPVNLCTHLSS
jgi:hypothetical protein